MLDAIKAYAAWICAAVLAGLLILTGAKLVSLRIGLADAKATIERERANRLAQDNRRRDVALEDAKETFRRNEIHARNQQAINDEKTKQDQARAAAVAAARNDANRLREQVRAFAAACGGGEAQTPAAAIADCRNRTATLGQLYEEADRQAGEFAAAAEQHADEIRTLKRVIGNDRALTGP